MQQITVTNNHKAIVNMAVYVTHNKGTDIENKSKRTIPLLPGLSQVSADDWGAIEKHPYIKAGLESGTISFTADFKVDKMKRADFEAALIATASVDMMALMLGQSKDNERRKLIKDRIKEIKRTTEPKE